MSSHTDTQKYNNPFDLKSFEANFENIVLTGFSLVVVVGGIEGSPLLPEIYQNRPNAKFRKAGASLPPEVGSQLW